MRGLFSTFSHGSGNIRNKFSVYANFAVTISFSTKRIARISNGSISSLRSSFSSSSFDKIANCGGSLSVTLSILAVVLLVDDVLEVVVLDAVVSEDFVDFFLFSVSLFYGSSFSDFPVMIFSAGFSTAFGVSTIS